MMGLRGSGKTHTSNTQYCHLWPVEMLAYNPRRPGEGRDPELQPLHYIFRRKDKGSVTFDRRSKALAGG